LLHFAIIDLADREPRCNVITNAAALRVLMLGRSTQTKTGSLCHSFAAAGAMLLPPLLDAGTSARLCLLPDACSDV